MTRSGPPSRPRAISLRAWMPGRAALVDYAKQQGFTVNG